MKKSGEARWIVIINKSPRGPLTREEIRTLLDEGEVRINDVAYKVKANEGDPASEWKFLWQFVEFDRRTRENANPEPAEKPPEDRRKTEKEPETEKKAIDLVPGDILNISPEDLIVHSQRQTNSLADISEPVSTPMREGFARRFKSIGILVGGMGVLALAITLSFWLQGEKKAERAPAKDEPKEVSAPSANSVPSSPGILGGPNSRRLAPAEPLRQLPQAQDFSMPPAPRDEPQRRDNGEVPYSEDRFVEDEDEFDQMERQEDVAPVRPNKRRKRPPMRKPAEDSDGFEGEMEPPPETGEVY